MKRYARLFLFLLFLSHLVVITQPLLAQQNQSAGRALGIGIFWPTVTVTSYSFSLAALDARIWLADILGVEGTLFVVPIPQFAPAVGLGGGLLLKIINGSFIDVYTGARLLLVSVNAIYLTASVTSASGTVGIEVSPFHQLALSADVSLWTILNSSISAPIEIPSPNLSGSALVFGLGIHYYF